MDPNATLAIWRDAKARYAKSRNQDEDALGDALDAADDLVSWLDGGGFAPVFGQSMSDAYDTRVAQLRAVAAEEPDESDGGGGASSSWDVDANPETTREVAESLSCPECGAAPFQQCDAMRRDTIHAGRIAAAKTRIEEETR